MLKAKSQHYILVGTFIIIALVALILFFLLKSGGWEKKERYYVELDNVAGLQLGASVLYEGYTIGEVVAIDPKAQDNIMLFDVALNIRADWMIPQDSVAIIDTVNLLSKESIIIEAGSSSDLIAPNGYISSREKTDIFATANELATKINVLAEEELIPLISENIELLNNTTKEISSKINATSENIYEVTQQLKEIMSDETYASRIDNFTKNMEETSKIVQSLTSNLEEMSQKTSSDIMSSTGDLSFILNTISNNIVELNESLDQTIRNFESFSRQMKNNPSVIIRGTENE